MFVFKIPVLIFQRGNFCNVTVIKNGDDKYAKEDCVINYSYHNNTVVNNSDSCGPDNQ